jgi:hypothetical protein
MQIQKFYKPIDHLENHFKKQFINLFFYYILLIIFIKELIYLVYFLK